MAKSHIAFGKVRLKKINKKENKLIYDMIKILIQIYTKNHISITTDNGMTEAE